MLPLLAPAATNPTETDHSLKNNFTEMKKLRFLSAALVSQRPSFHQRPAENIRNPAL